MKMKNETICIKREGIESLEKILIFHIILVVIVVGSIHFYYWEVFWVAIGILVGSHITGIITIEKKLRIKGVKK